MEIVALAIIAFIVIYVLFSYFRPHIEILQIENNKYRVLLWYSVYLPNNEEKRAWVKLFDYGKG